MPIRYEMSVEGDLVKVVAKGNISTADCLQLIETVLQDPRVHPQTPALIDFRDAVYAAPEKSDIMVIADAILTAKSRFKSNIAIVARGETILFAELLAAQVRNTTHIPIRVFADIAAAQAFCKAGSRPLDTPPPNTR